MLRINLLAAVAVGSVCGWSMAQSTPLEQETTRTSPESSQVVGHRTTVSQQEATLQFHFLSGDVLTVTLVDGRVTVERVIGASHERELVVEYERGGKLETSWRRMVAIAGRLNAQEVLTLVQNWRVEDLVASDAAAYEAVTSSFAHLVAATGPDLETVTEGGQDVADKPSDITVGTESGLEGLEALRALETLRVLERLETLERLERLAALEELKALEGLDEAFTGLVGLERLQSLESVDQAEHVARPSAASQSGALSVWTITREIGGDIVGLFATFVSLSALGFGLVFFAPRQLEVVADTVHHSFWRSFMIGLFAQPLIIPAFGMLLLGLALTVVGIVIIPFAAAAFVIAIALAITGGYLAVARSVGEAYLRQRMSRGYAVGSWLSYRYVVYGLLALLAIWLLAALLGPIPVAGDIALLSAVALTWMVATAGFGATLLSRAGIRGTFAHRFDQALSDEYLYHTPQATPVVRKHARVPKG